MEKKGLGAKIARFWRWDIEGLEKRTKSYRKTEEGGKLGHDTENDIKQKKNGGRGFTIQKS